MQLRSKTYRNYLKKHGRENQFFITAYIGIDLINSVEDKPTELSTSWKPRDIENSKIESKFFIQKSSLAYSVSTFEAFFDDFFLKEICNLNIIDSPFIERINGSDSKKSIFKKMELLVNNFQNLKTKEYYLVKSAIFWRNDLVHNVNIKFDSDLKCHLKKYIKDYSESYKNLDINELIMNHDCFKVPSFKETLSLMTSLRNFAAQINNFFMNEVAIDDYIKMILIQQMELGNIKNISNNTPDKKRKKYWDNVISTYVGLDKEGKQFFQESEFARELYKVKSIAELKNLLEAKEFL